MKFSASAELYKQALQYMPGGVNSPVRAFSSVGGKPLFIKKGKGSRIYDEDGNCFVDYVMSWGALIVGHARPEVIEAIKKSASLGTSFGAPTRGETELASLITKAFPSIEKLRLVSSGTEAAMSAVRVCRGATGRSKVIKFAGCYHGHSDGLLVKAGSGAATHCVPDSQGVPLSIAGDTIVCPYNDAAYVERVIRKDHRNIACVIVEPVGANMGVVPAEHGFLEKLRRITSRYSVMLIFDEVITGFRFNFGGAQKLFGIEPDITCLGKIIGGGLPMGAYGGKQELMEQVSPAGPVYQAGTLSGNPLSVQAGIATLKILSKSDYNLLNEKANHLCSGIEKMCRRRRRMNVTVNRAGSLFTVFFSKNKVRDFTSALASELPAYSRFFSRMLEKGFYMPPSQFEANFMSFSHSEKDVESTIDAFDKALR
jgi:glutamate-1-semialdehyde 2,1-aminomutase